jgi:hypothetical protein
MEVRIISEQEIRDMILSLLSEKMNSELWCEDGSIRQDIKVLKVRMHTRENANYGAIDDLFERIRTLENNIKQLKHITGWTHGYDDHCWEIEKSLAVRVGQLESEVEKL